jgi:hypothetical protein
MTYTQKDSYEGTRDDYWDQAPETATDHVAGSFVAGSSYVLTKAALFLGSNAAQGSVRAFVYSDDATTRPNAVLGTCESDVPAGPISATGEWVEFTFAGVALTNGTTYHLAFTDVAGYGSGGIVQVYCLRSGTGRITKDADGTGTWADYDATATVAFKTYETLASAAADRGMPRGMNRGMNRGMAAHHMERRGNLWLPRARKLIVPVGIDFTKRGI